MWAEMRTTTPDFFRRPNDWGADQVRVRIWVREFEVYLPVIFKETEIATTTAR